MVVDRISSFWQGRALVRGKVKGLRKDLILKSN